MYLFKEPQYDSQAIHVLRKEPQFDSQATYICICVKSPETDNALKQHVSV